MTQIELINADFIFSPEGAKYCQPAWSSGNDEDTQQPLREGFAWCEACLHSIYVSTEAFSGGRSLTLAHAVAEALA